jgi:hypothetical protein
MRCHLCALGKRLDPGAIRSGPVARHDLAAVGRHDALAATAALETSLDEDLDDSRLLGGEQLIL